MKERILNELDTIAAAENVRILLAAESGSRGWGFASADSDYDVRFIYVRRRSDYLRLEKSRDVIERPISDDLDINGWDLAKALRLLHGSNPILFEWFSSPIVYTSTPFAEELKEFMIPYFSIKKGLCHYRAMAKRNYSDYLQTDMVRLKKYFYVLRPLLASRWICEHRSVPPMLFSELVQTELEPEFIEEVTHLLDLKIGSPEVRMIPRCARLNGYIEKGLAELDETFSRLPAEPAKGWAELDKLFLSQLV